MEQVHGSIGCPPCNNIHRTIVMCLFQHERVVLFLILPLKHHFMNLVANKTYCIWNILYTSSMMCLTSLSRRWLSHMIGGNLLLLHPLNRCLLLLTFFVTVDILFHLLFGRLPSYVTTKTMCYDIQDFYWLQQKISPRVRTHVIRYEAWFHRMSTMS